MNVWELLLNILGWALVIILVFVLITFLAGSVLYIVKTMKTALKRQREARTPVTALSDEAIIELARSRAQQQIGTLDMFGNGTQFIKGAEFALEAKKERVDADSI